MKRVAVVFGGKSCEHDISIITACQVMAVLQEFAHVVPIYIDRDGTWLHHASMTTLSAIRSVANVRTKRVHLRPHDHKLYCKNSAIATIDVIMPALHGLNGEDGMVYALAQSSGIPCVGCDMTAASVGMDKIAMKLAFTGLELPVLPFVAVDKLTYLQTGVPTVLFPVIVKPANLGSSIGITVAKDEEGLRHALDVAFHFDLRALVETALTDKTEYNCSARKTSHGIEISAVEEPIGAEELLGFQEKYMSPSGKGMQSMRRRLPADIAPELESQIKDLTERAFLGLDCDGVVRVDFLYDKTEKTLYINEINTIPGSFSYYMWEASGKSFAVLLNDLIEQALEKARQEEALTFAFQSAVLGGVGVKTK